MSFYSGLAPALIGLTHVAVQFPAYEFLRARFTGQKMGTGPSEGDEKAHWFGILMATIISKITASSATYPHEVIRTRLQAQRRPVAGTEAYQGLGVTVGGPGASNGNGNGSAKQPKYRGVIQTFRTILHEEGWTAFYAGMGTNMVRAVPAAVVTMLTYEFTVTTLKKARHKGEARLGRGIEEAVSR